MSKLMPIILALTMLFSLTHSLTVGSCHKYSLDGQSCEECVDHYHLYQGSCYVDILGCKEYKFGNICHQCDNNYIMVNNLCCDHNCLAQLFRRQKSSSVSTTISANFETLSEIIPYLNDKYIKEGRMYNLVEIQTQNYIDARRFVFLYEFYNKNRVERWRAVVDITKKTDQKEIIEVDWSHVPAYENYLDFHHEEISLNQLPKDVSSLVPENAKLKLIKKAEFSDLTQYEVVFKTESKRIHYETCYAWNSEKMLLLQEIQQVQEQKSEFIPSHIKLQTQKQIQDYYQTNSNFQTVTKFLENLTESDLLSKIEVVEEKWKVKEIIEYSITCNLEKEIVKYYIVKSTLNGKIKIVDQEILEVKVEETIKQVAEEVLKNDDITDEELHKQEDAVQQLIQQAIQNVQGIRQQSDKEVPQETSAINALFKAQNPDVESYEIVRKFERDFETYKELTYLVKAVKGETTRYFYFFVLDIQGEDFTFWGQQEVDEPLMKEKEGKQKYTIPNPQEVVPESDVSRAIDLIAQEHPEHKVMKIRRSVTRLFPDERIRYIVVVRHETSRVRYVILEDADKNIWIQEYQIEADKLDQLTDEESNKIQVEQKLEIIVDDLISGCQISPEAQISTCQPIQILIEITQELQELELSDKEHQEINLMQFIRDQNPNIDDFQIIQIWKQQNCDKHHEVTILIKILGKQPVQYQYHYLIERIEQDSYQYLGSFESDKIIKNQIDKPIVPNRQTEEDQSHNSALATKIMAASSLKGVVVHHTLKRQFPNSIRYIVAITSSEGPKQLTVFQNEKFEIVCEKPLKAIDDIDSNEEVEQQTEVMECCDKPPKTKQVQVVVDPADVQKIVQQLVKPEKQVKEIIFTFEEAIEYINKAEPQTLGTKVLSSEPEDLPNSIKILIILESQSHKYDILIKKNRKDVIEIISFEKVQLQTEHTEEEEEEIEKIVQEIEQEDTDSYEPIDPESVWESKALQILTSRPLKDFERQVDLQDVQNEDQISEAILYLRADWVIIKDGDVIRVLEDINTPVTKQYSIYFYVGDSNEETITYKVYEFIIQIKVSEIELTYTVLSVKQVINSGKQTNEILHEQTLEQSQLETNVAYGYENFPLTQIHSNNTIKSVIAEVEARYSSLIQGQSIQSIEILELKSGKLNIIIRYLHLYFTIFWDPVLERILLLNSVSSFASEKFDPVESKDANPYYNLAVQYCVGMHDKEIGGDYEIVHSGQMYQKVETYTEAIYYVEISSGSKKYRCVTGVDRERLQVRQISFSEIVEISLDHYHFDQMTRLFIANYQKLTENEIQGSKDFKYAYEFALKQNSILETANLIGAAYKPQNLGFSYKMFFKLSDSRLVSVQIYIESFNMKLSQTSFIFIDFETNFASISSEGSDVNKVVQAAAQKAQVTLPEGQYIVHSIEGKDYLFGNLFKIIIEISGIKYVGILYHDHLSEETNLFQWKMFVEGQGCEHWEDDKENCKIQGCKNGYYWQPLDRQCYKATKGCSEYELENREKCVKCTESFSLLNNVCTDDCGQTCVFIKAF